MKWHRFHNVLSNRMEQYEISDELASLWLDNGTGNDNISDEPWPNIIKVTAFMVVEDPLRPIP